MAALLAHGNFRFFYLVFIDIQKREEIFLFFSRPKTTFKAKGFITPLHKHGQEEEAIGKEEKIHESILLAYTKEDFAQKWRPKPLTNEKSCLPLNEIFFIFFHKNDDFVHFRKLF